MKRNVSISRLADAAMAWLLSFCAAGCLASAFSLEVRTETLALVCALAAAVSVFCFHWKHGGVILLCAAALAAGYLWRGGTAWEQTKSLILQIAARYDSAYGIGMPALETSAGTDTIYPLAILGTLAALSAGWTLTRRKSTVFALLPALLPLAACLVVTDTVPTEGYLYGLMLGTLLLLLTDWVRRHSPAWDRKLGVMLLLPVATALGALFLAVPQKGYVNHAEHFQATLLSMAERALSIGQDVAENIGAAEPANERVDLQQLGPRVQKNLPVMRVTAPTDGVLYLREQDYNTYSGTGWVASRQRSEVFTRGGATVGELTIETYGWKDVLYVPYYAAQEITLTGGAAENSGNVSKYTYALSLEPDGGEGTYAALAASGELRDTQYLQLPSETLRWARELAGELTGESDAQTVQAITEYVRASAEYDLNTPSMDEDFDDFANWFLTRSETGYCVHFATAATVLLRAAGIPARYVEGYYVICNAGETTDVTGEMAHAWAEYYSGGAWRILEATPSTAAGEVASETIPETAASPEIAETLPETVPQTAVPSEADPAQSETSPASDTQTSAQEPSVPADVFFAMLWMLLALAAVWAQSEVRIRSKCAARTRGTPNRQALARWRQASQTAALLHVDMPEELEALAEKARYSQHTLTREELARFDAFHCAAWEKARSGPLRRLVLRLVFAVK